jgi:hypothetical protein
MKKYRIDYAFQKIYIFDHNQNAYLFFCTFQSIGAKKSNREKTILKLLEKDK